MSAVALVLVVALRGHVVVGIETVEDFPIISLLLLVVVVVVEADNIVDASVHAGFAAADVDVSNNPELSISISTGVQSNSPSLK